ncbi:GTPase domain-containing protein [Acanthopleuribacter pedis]|uniref:GTPase domain-containing protein n=1 Tax=Acanthopleuribacter pedis TaxID=442870 RepID=A0A8J7QLT8_9BACT|nr:GTPase domain-containing protein [Acanthopleuribacter pedis]MBO1322070.1 GTPase domain-containing protein [Acanthopleuribacter pedis]
MVLFNYATKELTAKVVYYGPGLCGKTTNLQYIYDTLPGTAKGKMLSLATKTDRTLFFDFLPIDLGKIRGMKTKIQLYTVPGQVFYDTTRKLVLKGADGVVFVADSQAPMIEANIDSFQNLITNLKEQNIEIADMPHVIQYNKRDMKNVMAIEELQARVNTFNVPHFEAIAPKGVGVFETLKGISKVVLKNLASKYGLEEEGGPAASSSKFAASAPPLPTVPGKSASRPKPQISAAPPKPAPAPKPAAAPPPRPAASIAPEPVRPASSIAPNPVRPPAASIAANPPTRQRASEGELDEIDFIEDEVVEPAVKGPARAQAPGLKPLPALDDSEVIELDDMDPLEIEELDDMAEIANMAEEDSGFATPQPPATGPVTAPPAAAALAPIEVPVTINLPANLAGKPLRLRLDITFDD